MKQENTVDTNRLVWVDIARFIGIFTIYLGHLEEPAGLLWPFVYTFHVPLFFMLSGFFAVPKREVSYKEYAASKAKTLALPYLFFCVINIVVLLIWTERTVADVPQMLKLGAMAVKNNIFALSLWFLPCLFVMSLFYEALRRLLKPRYRQWILLVIGVCLFVIAERFLPYRPYLYPKLIWGIDSAMYYFVFYAVGAAVFPVLKNLKFKAIDGSWKVALTVLRVFPFVYMVVVYFQKDKVVLAALTSVKLGIFYPIILGCIGSYAAILLAKGVAGLGSFPGRSLLSGIGQNTIILCGNESIIKLLLPWLLSLAGVSLNIRTPLDCCLYTLALLLLSYITIIPLQKKLIIQKNSKP